MVMKQNKELEYLDLLKSIVKLFSDFQLRRDFP